MRGVFGFLVVFVLGLIPLTGCGEEEAAGCNDGNACTWDYRESQWSPCTYEPWPDGSPCVSGGVTGVCVAGECGENLCEGVVCDDSDPCTDDFCIYASGLCEYLPCCGFSEGTEHLEIRACDFDGLAGLCFFGECREDPCAGVVCDDGDPCTVQTCQFLTGICVITEWICF
jgi:hypothetical protein